MHVISTRMPRIPQNCVETHNMHHEVGLGSRGSGIKTKNFEHTHKQVPNNSQTCHIHKISTSSELKSTNIEIRIHVGLGAKARHPFVYIPKTIKQHLNMYI